MEIGSYLLADRVAAVFACERRRAAGRRLIKIKCFKFVRGWWRNR